MLQTEFGFTLPLGLPVEMDADAGTMRFLQSAVI